MLTIPFFITSQHIQKLRKSRDTSALNEGGDCPTGSKQISTGKTATTGKRRSPAKKGAKKVKNDGDDDDDDLSNIKLESYKSDTEMESPTKKVKREQTVGYVFSTSKLERSGPR